MDEVKIAGKLDERQDKQVTRPWHAPQFVVSDFGLTQTASNAGHDGGVFPAYSQS
jgi:hypothetical protein